MNEKLSLVLGFVAIALIGYASYEIILKVIDSMKDINATVGVALIAGTTTIVSSVYIASYNSRKAKEKVAFEAHREKKAEIYNDFLEIITQIMKNTKLGKEGDDVLPENLEEFFYKFTAKITVYGGAGVVKAYSNWRSASFRKENSLASIDKLFREMRKDLGESNKGIQLNDLVGLYIVGGTEELEKAMKSNKTLERNS